MSEAKKTPVAIYTPDSQVRAPGKLLRNMIRDLWQSHELGWALFVRDLAAQYRQSLLGLVWAFIPPLLMAFFFIFLNSRRIVNLGETDIPYPLFVLIGTVLWATFAESIRAPLATIKGAKAIITKVNFPREALILTTLYRALFNFGIKLIIVAAVLLYFDVPLGWHTMEALAVAIMLVLLGIGLGLFLTPFGILYNDVGSGLGVVIQVWFFLTPVVYAPPKTFPFSLLSTVNPVSPLLLGARDLATKGALESSQGLWVMCGATIAVVVLSWILVRLSLPIVMERMSA